MSDKRLTDDTKEPSRQGEAAGEIPAFAAVSLNTRFWGSGAHSETEEEARISASVRKAVMRITRDGKEMSPELLYRALMALAREAIDIGRDKPAGE